MLQAGSERRAVRQPRICPRHSGLQVQVMHHSLRSATGATLEQPNLQARQLQAAGHAHGESTDRMSSACLQDAVEGGALALPGINYMQQCAHLHIQRLLTLPVLQCSLDLPGSNGVCRVPVGPAVGSWRGDIAQ